MSTLNISGSESFLSYVYSNFFHLPFVAISLLVLFLVFSIFFIKSLLNKKLTVLSRFSPSIMTAAGLLGTFVGLILGLKDLNLQTPDSIQDLVNGLKLVFIYSLFGVTSSILFMLLNCIPTAMQLSQAKKRLINSKESTNTYNQGILNLQEQQEKHLNELTLIQKKMQNDISKLQFDTDNEQLAKLIGQGVTSGLTPLLQEIKTAVADQGSEAIQQVLSDMKEQILVPMKGTLERTNTTLETTNQAVNDTIQAIKDTQEHNNTLVSKIESAASTMDSASIKMNDLVSSIDSTVNHLDRIQKDQSETLNTFNTDLKENLGKIQPAIEKGLETATTSLTTAITEGMDSTRETLTQAINDTSKAMQEDVKAVITTATGELNNLADKINNTVDHLDRIQKDQSETLNTFNTDLKENLGKIQPAIEKGLETATTSLTTAINTASTTMDTSIRTALTDSGNKLNASITFATTALATSVTSIIEKQNESIESSFNKFDEAQGKFERILGDFSTNMNNHLNRMANELENIGENSKKLIDNASDNLKTTLGDIDTKLINTQNVLKESLEKFREEYQISLTTYLSKQTENLDGFLDKQNTQLEETIGKQREGLEKVTNQLKEQFETMSGKQVEINKEYDRLITLLQGAETAILPKVATIAADLNSGEKEFAIQLAQSTKHLTEVSRALEDLGKDLPKEFEKSFETLHEKYKESFKDLDHGLKDSVGTLGTAVGTLTTVLQLHDAMNQD